MITHQQALNRLIDGNELFFDEMLDIMRQIMRGDMTPAQIAGILIGLRVKVESVSEIAAAATVMREFATTVPVAERRHLVDTCGTGGDGAHTFNISTTAAFIVAAAGAQVAKHGGRSVSSSSGSADVLEALGVKLALTAENVGRCIDEIGLGFMFAPNHHTAMKYVAPVRRELGVRTIFNILGPLTNPAGAENQLMGVFHPDLVGIQARVLSQLGARHAMVVHGRDGLDEISLSGPTLVAELKNGWIREYELDPAEFGFSLCSAADLAAPTAEDSKARLLAVLDNQPGPARDIVCLNAGAAIYVAGVTDSLAEGIRLAQELLASGAARQKLGQLVELTHKLAA
ncbi:anthranilate phosphoribosyltransferase [Laribacter hongkongensis]|uniref:Anthranilate phosphoribosyltransferase n=1 Tax=Laribacter hongkongensis TaxID=168471 RepID=A0AAW5DQJ1_9NEIS|nr:anthranilate phosphoribosyltransferase [Laribacter hongkongensis]MCG8994236.1 anthranilate phosphoribosyltransferase [Laribacter hongkongensis]MCG9009033.1 anthranilate phosphoribosyltransferase [Laribacter hongkongensis]MCG9021476.1 anthranilate phosphoribosyltransferase [Laribacter hongkongensis]MCG9025198.1 anthranilate phosphoribosyltransferase [Laribacter hongkongensis]MCG9046494.1 anthranilate phosphoribosyltransferase [Laribacter hongkongensis]